MTLSQEALAALRMDYAQRGLRRADLEANPIDMFAKWLAEAHREGMIEPNAMVLSTTDASGRLWSRVVLLKKCDEEGFSFFTNYEGAKATHLAQNSNAALTFWWGAMERQVNVSGCVRKTSREVSTQYFATRPRASQLGAWASPQSSVLEDRQELERRFAEQEARFEGKDVPCPENWGGYVLEPTSIEFWQGRRSRLHDRFRFTREHSSVWSVQRLSP